MRLTTRLDKLGRRHREMILISCRDDETPAEARRRWLAEHPDDLGRVIVSFCSIAWEL